MKEDKLHREDDRHYALDDAGNLVYLGNKSSTEIQRKDYICLGCGNALRPVQGKQREWHFRHKVNARCNKESYIHQLGKKIIKNKFDKEESFIIKYHKQLCCSNYNSCPFKDPKCRYSEKSRFDLKDWYDTCQEEKSGNDTNYRADLLLTHSQFPDRKPIYIEIAYKNDCVREKIASGIKIIEIEVENENDLEIPLEEPDYFQWCVDFDSMTSPYDWNVPPVRFYNFERRALLDKPLSMTLNLYIIANENGIMKPIQSPADCSVMYKEPLPQCVFMLCTKRGLLTGKDEFRLFGYLMAVKNGVNIKKCITCGGYGGCAKKESDEMDSYEIAANCPNYIFDNRRVQSLVCEYSFDTVKYWCWKRKGDMEKTDVVLTVD